MKFIQISEFKPEYLTYNAFVCPLQDENTVLNYLKKWNLLVEYVLFYK